MDSQQQAPQSIPQVAPVTPPTTPSAFSNPPKKKSHTFLLVIFALFILGFVGASGYFFGLQQGMQMPKQSVSSDSKTVTKESQASQNTEVTNKTKIAKSLTLPKLDPDMHWSNLTKVASDDGTMELMADKFDEQYVLIPFKNGKFYEATGAASVDLNSFFSTHLKAQGWVTPDTTDSFLIFKSFRLRGLIAQGTCGGIVGYTGYKDGMVRMIAVKQAAQTCLPPDQVKNSTVLQQQVSYTVFVSDPTPVQYFSGFVASHGKK